MQRKYGIIGYVERNECTLAESGLNEVDSLVLSQLAYLKFEGVFGRSMQDTSASENTFSAPFQWRPFSDVLEESCRAVVFSDKRYERDNLALARAVAASKRFAGLEMGGYVSILDLDREIQFAAIVFRIGGQMHYIAFRGTDENLVGWKEDLSLAFSEPVECQRLAASYLRLMVQKSGAMQAEGMLFVGGHSKGGNLAVYASMLADESVQERIRAVLSHDGPGFKDSVAIEGGYDRIEDKVHKYLPESSLVGLLLDREPTTRVIACYSWGLFQHNPYTWKVRGTAFRKKSAQKRNVKFIARALNGWILTLDDEQIRDFADVLFDVLDASEADTLPELFGDWKKTLHGIHQGYLEVDGGTRSQMSSLVFDLLEYTHNMAKYEIRERMEKGWNRIREKIPSERPFLVVEERVRKKVKKMKKDA